LVSQVEGIGKITQRLSIGARPVEYPSGWSLDLHN
jgi:hypothetical protein